jgi:pimeloyl-ACP methyl ester carboxylesterase
VKGRFCLSVLEVALGYVLVGLNYRITGEGPPLALLHGFGVSFSIWENLTPHLSPYFQLIMVEMPGTGSSPPPDPERPFYEYSALLLDELRQELNLEQWSVLGYSLGSRAAAAYVRLFPARLERVAFLCPLLLRPSLKVGLHSLIAVDRRRPAFGDWLISGWRLYWLVRLLGFNLRAHPQAYAWTNEITAQVPAYLKVLLYGLEHERRGAFEVGTVPTLYVWGRRDLIAHPPLRTRPEDVIIPADHSAPVDAAPTVAAVILPFFLGE